MLRHLDTHKYLLVSPEQNSVFMNVLLSPLSRVRKTNSKLKSLLSRQNRDDLRHWRKLVHQLVYGAEPFAFFRL